jgi:hypothetical protein
VKRLRSNVRKKETSGGGSERRIVKRESDCETWSEKKGTKCERSEKGTIEILLIETETETETGIEIETGTGTGTESGTEAAIETVTVTVKAKTHVKKTRFCPRS